MKSHYSKCILTLFALTGILLSSFTTDKPALYKVDITRSVLNWTGYYVFSFSEHNGTINISAGELKVENDMIVSGYFDIDMKTIKDLDMSADQGAKDLEQHLMSDDFFSVDKFQTAHFEITKTEKIKDPSPGDPNYDVTGDLTLKGVKNSLTFPAHISFGENGVEAKAKFKFDRTRWNVRYNSGKFFFDIGDGAISDAIGMEVHLVTSKN